MLLVVQAPPAFPLEVNVVVAPTHTSWIPLSDPALAAALTVTVRVAVALVEQGEVAVTVYVMVDVPMLTALITPEALFTVATAVLLEVHVPPA